MELTTEQMEQLQKVLQHLRKGHHTLAHISGQRMLTWWFVNQFWVRPHLSYSMLLPLLTFRVHQEDRSHEARAGVLTWSKYAMKRSAGAGGHVAAQRPRDARPGNELRRS